MELRENTIATIKMGPFTLDGKTPLSSVSPAVWIHKNGTAAVARNSATAITHDRDGYYLVELSATDTNARGRLRATATDAATHLQVWEDFEVVAADWHDEKYGPPAATLQSATANSAQLDAGASAVNDFYNGLLLVIRTGTGAGQARRIPTTPGSYVGATKTATVEPNWTVIPDATSTFDFVPFSLALVVPTAVQIADEVQIRALTLSAAERNAIADAKFDRANAIEVGLTERGFLRLQAAAAFGKGPGPDGATAIYRAAVQDHKARITATVNASGDRTAMITDQT